LVPDKSQPLALKSIKARHSDGIRQARLGMQAQYLAGALTRRPQRVCVGILPVYAAWRCAEKDDAETEYFVMPKRGVSLFKWAKTLDLDMKLLETVFVPNLLRLVTAMISYHQALDLSHNDLHMGNILAHTQDKATASVCYRFHHQKQSLLLPPVSEALEITDFGMSFSTKDMDSYLRTRVEHDEFSALLGALDATANVWMARFPTPWTDTERDLRKTWHALLASLKASTPGPLPSIWDLLWKANKHPWLAPWMGEEPPTSMVVVDLDHARSRSATGRERLEKTKGSQARRVQHTRRRASMNSCLCC
jgi:hypothetical protein